jgi:predicted RNase H-like nuclease (RuvC/YqgF family)
VNKKKQNKIKKKILKDQDESQYGLDKFNNELQESEKEISSIAEKKQEALTLFENTTRFVIGEEIKLRYQEEIKTLKQEYDSTYNEIRMLEENIKNMTMELSSDYEVYLGKEFMSAERLDKLAELMSANNLSTISEAITLYSQERQ